MPSARSAGKTTWLQPYDDADHHLAEDIAHPQVTRARRPSRPASPIVRKDGRAEPRSSQAPARAVQGGQARRAASARPARSRHLWTGGRICGLFAVDIAGFTDPCRDEQVQLYLRERIYQILERAFDGSGMPWRACHHEDRGDGALIIVPPVLPPEGLADPLPERLCGLVRVHNRLSAEDARIQLRAAAHVGTVYHDDHGFGGDATSHLRRLLDAPGLKQMLTASSSDLAFITSDYFYNTVVRRHPTLVDPAVFQPLSISLRRAQATGWVQLLGATSTSANVFPFDRPA